MEKVYALLVIMVAISFGIMAHAGPGNTTNITASNSVSSSTSSSSTSTISQGRPGGFGELAGHLVFNVTQGSSEYEYWGLVNKYDFPVKFYIQNSTSSNCSTYCSPITLESTASQNTIIKNPNVMPIIYLSEMNGTIPANTTIYINVTVKVPMNTSLNATWQGYATAYATTLAINSTFASISIGTAKLIEITAHSPPKKRTTTLNTTSSTTIPQTAQKSNGIPTTDIIIILIVIVVCLAIGMVYLYKRKK